MKSDLYTPPEPGTFFHWLQSGLTFSRSLDKPLSGVISVRGRTEVATPELIAATSNIDGESFLSLIGDPAAQERRWGRVFMAPGRAPAELEAHPWEPGSPEEQAERSVRVAEAMQLPSRAMRDAALTEINRTFPRSSKPTSSLLYRHRDGEFA